MPKPKKIFIAAAGFYPEITGELLKGAKAEADRLNMEIGLKMVPGVLELPVALAIALRGRKHGWIDNFDCCVALGCVIRGETSHYDIVAKQSAAALMNLAIKNTLPFGNGILTTDNMEQAKVRADASGKNKGGAAVKAAYELFSKKSVFIDWETDIGDLISVLGIDNE